MNTSLDETDPPEKPRRWKRWVVALLLALLIAGIGAYHYFTRPDRIRVYAERWIEQFTGGDAYIEQIELQALQNLTLSNITLALPERVRFDPTDTTLESRTAFRASKLFARFKPFSLLTGQPQLIEIVAENPEITFVYRMKDGATNWQAMLANRKTVKLDAAAQDLPAIHLRNARLLHERLTPTNRLPVHTQNFWADAQPATTQPAMYDIRITQIERDLRTAQPRTQVANLQVDPQTLTVRGDLPALPLTELLLASSPDVVNWAENVGLTGSVRPEGINLATKTTAATFQVVNASLAIPLDENEEKLPLDQRYLRFERTNGRIEVVGSAANLHLNAMFHGAPVKVSGSIAIPTSQASGFDAVALDLNVDATELPLPRDDAAYDAAQSRFVKHWPRLKKLVDDFAPLGSADLSVRIRKLAGKDKGIEFVGGDLRPRGASAQYLEFPYRVSNLTGLVHFRSDGTETIDLKGSHEGSAVTFTGWEGGFKTQAGELTIHAQNLSLDRDLNRCLTEEDRELVQRFNLQARMDLEVIMKRADKPPRTPDNPWKAVIDVALRDGSMRFEEFPYLLQQLTGKLHIADGALKITDLTGRRLETVVRVNGNARWSGLKNPEFNLQLDARNVLFDSALGAALPAALRGRYQKAAPVGQFNLSGKLRGVSESADLDYDLLAVVQKTDLTWPPAGDVRQVDAQVRITPKLVTIENARGLLGESQVTGQGSVDLIADEPTFSLHFSSERLHLDENVRAVLPPDYQDFWDDFKPAGLARVDVKLARGHSKEHANPSENALDYTLIVEPLGASATYQAFPLPIDNLEGTFTATPRKVEIREIRGTSGDASIFLSGDVKPVDDHYNARMNVRAKRIKLDEKLRRALPYRIRRQWNALKPTGEIDVDFKEVEFATGSAEGSWQFEGMVQLHDVSLEVGPNLSNATGTIRGFAQIGDQLALDGTLDLDRIRVDKRQLTKTHARIERGRGDSVVYLRDFRTGFYGGNVTGRARLDYGPATPVFNVSLDANGVLLEDFLNATRDPGEQIRAKGIVEGGIQLSGRFDDPNSRQGSGNIRIQQAQMFKIPLMLAILQVLNFTLDDNAFHDASLHFNLRGRDLRLDEIDLRGKALSMVGAGQVDTETEKMNLGFLVGSAVRLPRIAVLTDLIEGVAREIMEVKVEGTPQKPTVRAEMVRSLHKAVDGLFALGGRSRK